MGKGPHKDSHIELPLGELRTMLAAIKDKIAVEREAIFGAHKIPAKTSRDEYVFAYLHAERLGMQAIRDSLEVVSWLPTQLDPDGEVDSAMRAQMRDWIMGKGPATPDAEQFGNDFIHALTRGALNLGLNKKDFHAMVARVGALFHDLACLISMIHCVNELRSLRVEKVSLSDATDLAAMAHDLLVQMDFFEAEAEAAEAASQAAAAAANNIIAAEQNKKRAHLRLVKNDGGMSGTMLPAST